MIVIKLEANLATVITIFILESSVLVGDGLRSTSKVGGP